VEPGPAQPGGGDNLFISSILAVRPDSGELVWYYQTTPGDNWDYTAVQQMVLADLMIDGVERKVLMQAPKNGFFYVLDRLTGELISAEPYSRVNWASGVDLQTGRPIEQPRRTLPRRRCGRDLSHGAWRPQLASDGVAPGASPDVHPGHGDQFRVPRRPEQRQRLHVRPRRDAAGVSAIPPGLDRSACSRKASRAFLWRGIRSSSVSAGV
jgi:hypothetical protein